MQRAGFVRLTALAAALALATGCGSQENTERDEYPSFVRDPSDRPVVPSGVAGWPSLVADPSIIADDEGYHLFYSALFCRQPDGSYSFSWDPERPQECSLREAVGATAYAFSRDAGRSWEFRRTPVVLPGTEPWNDGVIETPFACRVADRLHVFYCALGARAAVTLQHRFQLGVATLALGARSIREALLPTDETFVHRKEPVVAADLVERYGINNAQEPSVVVRDGRFELYFVSLGLSKPGEDITAPGQEVSLALRLVRLDQALSPLEPPSAPLATGAAANITEVRFFDGRYHLFATTAELDDHENDELTYSVSGDGLHFTAPTTILRRRPGAGFDNWGLMAPTVVVEPETVLLFYTAWEMQEHRCQLAGTDGRMGMAQESRPDEARCLYATLGRAVSRRAGGD
jgi:predicted GH43/DUF377 family glycosyl hydrolase